MGRSAVALLVPCALLAGACASTGSGDSAPTTTRVSAPSSAVTVVGESAGSTEPTVGATGDIDHLVEAIFANHPDPFHHRSEAEFEAAVATARTAVDAAPDDREVALVAAMRIANLGWGDGHGGVYPWSHDDLRAWPLHLYDFAGEIRLVGRDVPDVPTGSRLVAVDGVPVDVLVETVEPLVPHDNDQTVRARLPDYLAFPSVLRGAGLAVDDAATITWEFPDGTSVDVPAPPVEPATTYRERLGLFQVQVPPSLPPVDSGVQHLRNRDEALWFEDVGTGALYVGWNLVYELDAELRALEERLTADPPRIVVVDARNNPGGDIGDGIGLVALLADLERAVPGTVRLIVGRSTFSAATHNIADLLAEVDVLVVGERTGGSPMSYADPRRIELPRSGVFVWVDSKLYEADSGDWDPIAPDIAIELTWDDVAAGRDPVLDAALAAA